MPHRCELVDDHADGKRNLRLEGHVRGFDGEAAGRTGAVAFDLLIHHLAQGNVAPLVARDELIRRAEGTNAH